jgi:dissimilatory sulfite reductase (desulfoviridin) alpha/beta subunit
MLIFILIPLALAFAKGYRIRPLFRVADLYPFLLTCAIHGFFIINAWLGNHAFVKLAEPLQHCMILTLLVPIVRRRIVTPTLIGAGLTVGGTGPRVRPIVSCKGTTCQFGLIDTFGLSLQIHERFYVGYHNDILPHKFKIGVGGCPNNCVKPDLNDLGIVGQRIFTPDFTKCRGCGKCAVADGCPMKAASVAEGRICIDETVCNHCGRCFKKCPFGVFEEASSGYKVCIGGRWGKKCAVGKPLSKIFTSQEEVLDVVERAIILFRDEGIKGERFADTIERLGFDYVEKKLRGE